MCIAFSASLATACIAQPTLKTTQYGVRAPAREPECSLVLNGPAEGLERLGDIIVTDEERRAYSDPELLQLVKPEACKLGGEVVTATSETFDDGIVMRVRDIYVVWRRNPAPTGPTTF
jgi:hypothetical protein